MNDPLKMFEEWFSQAADAGVFEPEACVLATTSKEGRPSARVVLYRGMSDGGLRFFTNYHSRKGKELTENPFASLVFYWGALKKQIRVEGDVEKLSAAESDEYFHARPSGHQINAVASPQSQTISGLDVLEKKRAELVGRYQGKEVPRPAHWGGFRVVPTRMEFWTMGEDRFHERILFQRTNSHSPWQKSLLAP